MFGHFGRLFHSAQDVLFALEFLIVQIFVIVHMVRALFLPQYHFPRQCLRRKNRSKRDI
jgi:hypothetical protein